MHQRTVAALCVVFLLLPSAAAQSEPGEPEPEAATESAEAAAKPAEESPAAEPMPEPSDAPATPAPAPAPEAAFEPPGEATTEPSPEPPAKPAAKPDEDVEVIVVVGARAGAERTVHESPVAVDVIDLEKIMGDVGQVEINQLLQYAAPSFNANRQSGADGADHIDPATLRGLGPDQTLVLVNGKRRHQTSLVNVFGSRGRGNTGTDLNTIPLAAIERIEILRDGASAQYGSDAIAGVVNIVLKSSVDELTANVAVGVHNAKPPSEYDVLRDEGLDGGVLQLNGNYGTKLGDDGFLNLTADFLTKDGTNRPADPKAFGGTPRRQYGDAALENFSGWANLEVPLVRDARFYAFGGLNYRDTVAYAWTRFPDDEQNRNVLALYPNGFDPRITSQIWDRSISAGVRTDLGSWKLDLNNTYGSNRFHYIIKGTVNASLLERSPQRFDAGGHVLSQNTTGLHLTRALHTPLAAVHVALGGEYRIDRFEIFAGEEGSYMDYGDPDRPGGSQGFPGFRPANEVDEARSNIAAYVDSELDFTEALMAGAALRYESYSDFGNTVTGKLTTRYELLDEVAVRASATTGFRAPSLVQKHFNTTITDFEVGQPVDKIIAKNNSPITRTLGIPLLKEEQSRSLSAGLTARWGDLDASIDGYYVQIKDRIVLTGAFDTEDPEIGADLQALGVGAAQFFTNALDTATFGLDLVVSWGRSFGEHGVRASFIGNFNKMELGEVKTSDKLAGKEDIYFGVREEHFLLASAPSSKLNLTFDYDRDPFGINVRVVRFAEVALINWLVAEDDFEENYTLKDAEDVYGAAYTIDVTLKWDITERLALRIGVANLLNAYPTQQEPSLTETGGPWDAVQMGFAGSFYFARLGVRM